MVSVRLGLGVVLVVALAGAPAAAQSREVPDAVADAIVALRTEALLLVELDGLSTVPASLAVIHEDWVGYTNGATRDDLLRWLYEVDDAGAAALSRIAAAGIRPAPAVTLTLAQLPSSDRLAIESLGTIAVSSDQYVAAIDSLAARLGPAFSVPEAPVGGPVAGADAAVPSATDQSRRSVAPNSGAAAPYPWAAVSSALLAVLMAGMLMILVGRRSTGRYRRTADDEGRHQTELDAGEPVPIP